jgi:hypothetical protein
MLRIASSIATLCCFVLTPASAAPTGLLNKTVHVTFSMFTPSSSDTALQGRSRPPRIISLTMYVSSAGRVFTKTAQRAGGYSNGSERVGGNFQFAGTKMVGVYRFQNAATQMTVSFDSSFQSCSVHVIVGGENGKPIEWIGMDGVKRTASGPTTVSGQSCSVENGNAFAK